MPDKIATRLVRIALDPVSGRLRHPNALAIGVRAALLADLALADCLRDGGKSPIVTPAPFTGDRILDTLRTAVDNQPGYAWRRWFTYVRADRDAVCRELVDTDRWSAVPGRRGRFRDSDPDDAVALLARTLEVVSSRRVAADGGEAVLAALTVVCGAVVGRPRPKAMDGELLPLLDVMGTLQDPIRRACQASLDSASAAARRRHTRTR